MCQFLITQIWEAKRKNHLEIAKGQLIFEMFFRYLQCSQKIQLYYYGTSSWIVFVHFLRELNTPKRRFEINWPLVISESHQTISRWLLTASDRKGGNLVVSHSLYQRKPATKGQLISEWNFGVCKSIKKTETTKFFKDFCPSL